MAKLTWIISKRASIIIFFVFTCSELAQIYGILRELFWVTNDLFDNTLPCFGNGEASQDFMVKRISKTK